jgi:hypothetical protein
MSSKKTKNLFVSCKQNAGQNYNIKTADNLLKCDKEGAIGIKGTDLIPFGTESFVFQFAIQEHKVKIYKNYNVTYCFVWK